MTDPLAIRAVGGADPGAAANSAGAANPAAGATPAVGGANPPAAVSPAGAANPGDAAVAEIDRARTAAVDAVAGARQEALKEIRAESIGAWWARAGWMCAALVLLSICMIVGGGGWLYPGDPAWARLVAFCVPGVIFCVVCVVVIVARVRADDR